MPRASSRCSADISLSGRPRRARGTKCQLRRSASSNSNSAFERCSASRLARNASAACSMSANSYSGTGAQRVLASASPRRTAEPASEMANASRRTRGTAHLLLIMAPPPWKEWEQDAFRGPTPRSPKPSLRSGLSARARQSACTIVDCPSYRCAGEVVEPDNATERAVDGLVQPPEDWISRGAFGESLRRRRSIGGEAVQWS